LHFLILTTCISTTLFYFANFPKDIAVATEVKTSFQDLRIFIVGAYLMSAAMPLGGMAYGKVLWS